MGEDVPSKMCWGEGGEAKAEARATAGWFSGAKQSRVFVLDGASDVTAPDPMLAGEMHGIVPTSVCASVSEPTMKERYPMMCWCSTEGPQHPEGLCRATRQGHRGRLPLTSKLLWAAPFFGWHSMKSLKVGYMQRFYTDDYPRASFGIMAFASVLSVLMDAFTDPTMASWTDGLRSKFGRRRPFIFAAAFFVPTAITLGWTPSLVSPGIAASLWYGAFHIMYKLADTLLLIPLEAWGAQLTPVYKESTSVWTTRKLMGDFGIIVGIAVVPFFFVTRSCLATPDDGCVEFPAINIVYGIGFACSALLLAWRGKEPPPAAKIERVRYSCEDTIPMLIATFLNRPFRSVLAVEAAKAAGQDIPYIILPYLTAWLLGEKCLPSTKVFQYIVLCNLGMGLLSVPLWSCFVSRTSKHAGTLAYNLLLGVVMLVCVSFGHDSGDCSMTTLMIGVLGIAAGPALAGNFIVWALLADSVDYDELLTGGRRREASYYMAAQFVPKFLSIPAESVPFLLLAYFKYARPLKASFKPLCGNPPAGMTPDDLCHAFYMNETAGANWCSDILTCQNLHDNGVTFICDLAFGECGIKQNDNVRMVLRMCLSMIPSLFGFLAAGALIAYPKQARSEEAHTKVIAAIARVKQGEIVEDPWRPGSMIHPAEPPTELAGALSYFWPSELKSCLDRGSGAGAAEPADVSRLWHRPLAVTLVGLVLIPPGIAVVTAGFPDLFDDLGASVSPLGLMAIGVGISGAWFNGMRVRVALHLQRVGVSRKEVAARYNVVAPFVGGRRVDL